MAGLSEDAINPPDLNNRADPIAGFFLMSGLLVLAGIAGGALRQAVTDAQDKRRRRLPETARNPQRRPVLTFAAGRRVPTREMTTDPGRPFQRYRFSCYRGLATRPRSRAAI